MNPLTLVKRIQKINSREAALGISEEASWHAKYKDSAYIFVGGIPFDLTEGDLLAVFAQYGEIVDVNLVRDKGTGKSKGFAFLAYEDQRSTNLAVDNLNGAQVLGRTIRVDHVSNYKKKEEDDEEIEQQKREARGVCRAFQRGECTRGASCKFSHDEQRGANTGWGPQDVNRSRWGHEKFEGAVKDADKREIWRRDDEKFRQRENQNKLEIKRSKRHDDDNIEQRSEEYHSGREGKRSRRQDNEFSLQHRPREDRSKWEEKCSQGQDNIQYRREDKRSRRHDDELGSRSREEDRKEDRYLRGQNYDELKTESREGHHIGDKRRYRRSNDDEVVPRSKEDRHQAEEKRSNRHAADKSEANKKDDFDRRVNTSRMHQSEPHNKEGQDTGVDRRSSHASHHRR